MQDQPSRLDRIEAALEAFQQRMETHFDQQMQLNAAFRTELEVQKNAAEALRSTAHTLLQIVQLHQQNIEVIAEAVLQHRADGHGT